MREKWCITTKVEYFATKVVCWGFNISEYVREITCTS